MNIDNDLHREAFCRREEQQSHLEYNLEYQFYNAVSLGDTEKVCKYLMNTESNDVYNEDEYGKLSNDALQNSRYHFVVAVALITRICVEHGLNREEAYTLSDLFIQKMDSLKTICDISVLHNKMIIDFTERMKKIKKEQIYSIHVIKAMDYIYIHLHEKIKVSQIAENLSLNRSYLSSLFSKETGMSINQYIISEKIKSASHMLTSSEMTYSDIAEYYGFSSQSHFANCFKKETGYTPMNYRKMFYQKSGT